MRPSAARRSIRNVSRRYRPNVAAIIQRADGRVLLGQRSDFPASWQFPQGGIDAGEDPEEALQREVEEETGLTPQSYRIVARSGWHRYDFPAGPDRRGFDGQEQMYFLCRLPGPEMAGPDADGTCGEFLAFRWQSVAGFPFHLAPPMKQAVYRAVLRELAEHLS